MPSSFEKLEIFALVSLGLVALVVYKKIKNKKINGANFPHLQPMAE